MKIFSLILSVVTAVAALSFLIADFPDMTTFSGIILFLLLVILMLICITGIVVNFPFITRVHHKFKTR